MKSQTLRIRLDRPRTIEDLALDLSLEPEDPFDPQLWASGGVSMRTVAPTTFCPSSSTVTVEFRWPDNEDGPDDWSWALTKWATVLDGLSEGVA